MNIIDFITYLVIVLAMFIVYLIYKFVSDRKKKCGTDALCYLTGIPNTMDYIKKQVEDQINNAIDSINPF